MQIIAAITPSTRDRCFPPAAWEKLSSLAPFRHVDPSSLSSSETLAAHLRAADILLTGWGTPPLIRLILDACPNLKYIAHAAGSVAFIDLHAWRRHILVTNVMPIMGLGVAEFTLTCILSALRRLDALLKPALWDTLPFYQVPKVGFMLREKTVGLVGLGIIGRQTLDLLRPFGCRILVHDPFLSASAAHSLGVETADLPSLLRSSDIVSLHAPGTPATRHLLSRDRLALLKPGSILINTARGILIDHAALAEIAAPGHLAVYLDVTDPEPLPPDHPLRHLPNVILTPHVAGPTSEAWPQMGAAAVADIERFLRGEKPLYPVTEAQYANQSTS
jgi:phosphoglycerate dehydrogenase-like enzyme